MAIGVIPNNCFVGPLQQLFGHWKHPFAINSLAFSARCLEVIAWSTWIPSRKFRRWTVFFSWTAKNDNRMITKETKEWYARRQVAASYLWKVVFFMNVHYCSAELHSCYWAYTSFSIKGARRHYTSAPRRRSTKPGRLASEISTEIHIVHREMKSEWAFIYFSLT